MKPLTFVEEPYAGESPPKDDAGGELASRWMPEPDLVTHQLIGKLGEEAAELAAICSRILIQGLHQSNPDDGKANVRALIEEISDVGALIDILYNRLLIRIDMERYSRKIALKESWLDQLKEKS